MSGMTVTTKQSDQIWQSPDGKRTIWEATLEATDGTDYKLKTYSPMIAKIGWSGDVRSYLNPRGDRFVRHLKEERPSYGQGNQQRGSGYTRDDLAIRAQWAIGQAINLASVKMDKEAITMPVIEQYAKELFEAVGRVKGEPLSAEDKQAGDDYISGMTTGERTMSASVKLAAIFAGIKSRKDRSYRLEFDTRELGTDAVELLKIHGTECWLLIAPGDSLDAVDVPKAKPDAGTGQKTPGQRLRAVLFVLWQQVGKPGDFEDYYRQRLDRIIDQYKAKLDGDEVEA